MILESYNTNGTLAQTETLLSTVPVTQVVVKDCVLMKNRCHTVSGGQLHNRKYLSF